MANRLSQETSPYLLQRAQVLADVLLAHFHDNQGGGFFYTAAAPAS